MRGPGFCLIGLVRMNVLSDLIWGRSFRPVIISCLAKSQWFYAFSPASSSSKVAAVVKLSTPKTTSANAEPGSNPQ